MILRAAGVGFLLWLAFTAAFRFAGQYFFIPDETLMLALFIATPLLMAALTFLLLRLLREARGDEAEAAIGLAFPGMFLDVFVTREFPSVFPNLDPALDGAFGALLLLAYGAVVLTGLMSTRLAPQDERIGLPGPDSET